MKTKKNKDEDEEEDEDEVEEVKKEEEDEEEEEEDEEEDETVFNDLIENNENNDEIKVEELYNEPIRSERIIIISKPENRITSDFMTKQEYTEALSTRIMQLEQEQIAFVDISDLSNPVDIAKREIAMKKCPLILRRHLGSKIVDVDEDENITLSNFRKKIIKPAKTIRRTIDYYEYWEVNELSY